MRTIGLFLLAGLCEIGGGYLVWLWLREHRPVWLGLAGMLVLAAYGVIPTFQPVEHPFGRVYAAYGAVFIVLAAAWGWAVDGRRLDTQDLVGLAVCLTGTVVVMWPRGVTAG